MAGLVVLVLVAIVAAMYFLPTIVAGMGRKRKTGAIFALNLFLGWTFLGWVVSLVWAIADERSAPAQFDPGAGWAPPAAAPATTATASAPPAPTWRALPTPGQRVHLMAATIVRTEPQRYARSTTELRPGTDVTVLRTSSGWAFIQTDSGEEGWVEL